MGFDLLQTNEWNGVESASSNSFKTIVTTEFVVKIGKVALISQLIETQREYSDLNKL